MFVEQLTLLFAKTKVSTSYFKYVRMMDTFEAPYTEQIQKGYLEFEIFLDLVEEIALSKVEASIKNDLLFLKEEASSGIFPAAIILVSVAMEFDLPVLALEIQEWANGYFTKEADALIDKKDPVLVKMMLDNTFGDLD